MIHRGPFQPLLFCDSVILCAEIGLVSLCSVAATESRTLAVSSPHLLGLLDTNSPGHSVLGGRAAMASQGFYVASGGTLSVGYS